jgi:hypothetical protein
MFEQLTCLLCGRTDRDVETTWVRWTEPDDDGHSFGTTNRCKDRVACAKRVELNGEPWPVSDGMAYGK